MAETPYIQIQEMVGNTDKTRHEKVADKKALLKADLGFVEMKSSTYTGNGETSLEITGIGFTPKYLKIWVRATSDGSAIAIFETTAEIIDDNASGMSVMHDGDGNEHTVQTNTIISLNADGFTVDDNGADQHPNKSSQIYNYIAIG